MIMNQSKACENKKRKRKYVLYNFQKIFENENRAFVSYKHVNGTERGQ